MSDEFSGRVILVTGGGSGIGAACCRLFAERGGSVVVADVDVTGAKSVAAEIGAAATFVEADVSLPEHCDAMVRAALDTFGRLDAAVNNAGIGGPQALTAEYPIDAWSRVIAVNLTGPFLSMRSEIPAMLESGGGSIVNMASILGTVGLPGSPAYVAAKHGLVGLTKATALEYAGQRIRVNSIGPGFIDTPLLAALSPDMLRQLTIAHPIGRLGRSEEVAELAAFLASDRASNTTGSYFLTDGGYTAQ